MHIPSGGHDPVVRHWCLTPLVVPGWCWSFTPFCQIFPILGNGTQVVTVWAPFNRFLTRWVKCTLIQTWAKLQLIIFQTENKTLTQKKCLIHLILQAMSPHFSLTDKKVWLWATVCETGLEISAYRKFLLTETTTWLVTLKLRCQILEK